MCIKYGNIYQNGHFPLKVLNEITKFSIAAHLYVTVAIFLSYHDITFIVCSRSLMILDSIIMITMYIKLPISHTQTQNKRSVPYL